MLEEVKPAKTAKVVCLGYHGNSELPGSPSLTPSHLPKDWDRF